MMWIEIAERKNFTDEESVDCVESLRRDSSG